jgi:DNA-directed RNA polymerase II subunit RPB9
MDIDNDWNQEEFNENDVGNYGVETQQDLFDLDLDSAPMNASMSPHGVLLMRFCPHDSSMLYPKEHKASKALHYACRLCPYTEQSNNPMIYRNVIKKEAQNTLHTVPGAIIDDPTLPRSQNAPCDNCGHHEAVFFQSDNGQSDSLALIFVCTKCEYKRVK